MVVSSRMIRNVGFLRQFLTFLMCFFFSRLKASTSFSDVSSKAVFKRVIVNYISLKETG